VKYSIFQLKVEGPVYKPVEVISSYGHLVGDGFASALNKAVNSVFTLTAKMACACNHLPI
jgi:hypothetical protein